MIASPYKPQTFDEGSRKNIWAREIKSKGHNYEENEIKDRKTLHEQVKGCHLLSLLLSNISFAYTNVLLEIDMPALPSVCTCKTRSFRIIYSAETTVYLVGS